MSIIHHWLPGDRVLHTRYIDAVNGEELLQAALDVSGDFRFDDLRGIIGDWTEAFDAVIDVADVERLVACIKAISRSNPNITNLNVVREGGEAPQALVSLYEMLINETPWTASAVNSLEQAKQQLSHWVDDPK